MMPLSLYVLAAVLCFIAIRQCVPWPVAIWHVMLAGGIVVLLAGKISLAQAADAIDWNVIGYLIGVFYLGYVLESSRYLEVLLRGVLVRRHHAGFWLFGLIMVSGLSSALLMNDTVVVMMVPLVFLLASHMDIPVLPFLLAVAYAVTIGSVMSPIGNPQNLMIVTHSGMAHPFYYFFSYLFIPTMINLGLCFVWLYWGHRKQWGSATASVLPHHADVEQKEINYAKCCCLLFVVLLALKIILMAGHATWTLTFSMVSLLAVLPHFIFSKKRMRATKGLDWGTVFFFIGMFVLMKSVWNTGLMQHYFATLNIPLHHRSVIMVVSLVLSQIVSNVPCVALYLPYLQHAGHLNPPQLLALAVGSTMAGSFLLFGAASNIIVVQQAQKKGSNVMTLWQHAKWGVPLGVVNVMVYYLFLCLMA